jgi:hypothetical protein
MLLSCFHIPSYYFLSAHIVIFVLLNFIAKCGCLFLIFHFILDNLILCYSFCVFLHLYILTSFSFFLFLKIITFIYFHIQELTIKYFGISFLAFLNLSNIHYSLIKATLIIIPIFSFIDQR